MGKKPEHWHNWVLQRTQTKIVKGKTVTYKFYKCVSSNCPNPNKMEIS